MAMNQALLAEWDHEMGGTRKALAAIPDGKHDWTPHAKSFTTGKLATHIATMGMFASSVCASDALDLATAPKGPTPTTTAELLAVHDEWAAKGRAAIATLDDAAMMKPWTLKMGDHVIFSMPRAVVLRSFVMNHLVHHRGQLTVYLRLLDAPVPGLFGPSADER